MKVTDRSFVDPSGFDIPLRVYRPAQADTTDSLPLVLFCHGDGFALGDLDSYDSFAKRHAVGTDAIAVSVDYRLAPEHPYPAAVDDAWGALQWVTDNAEGLGGDSSRIAVAGDSAGGNLAAVLALLARDAGKPDLLFQLLWYPMTTRDLALPSFTENAHAPILNLRTVKALTDWYAGAVALDNPPHTLAPASADSHVSLPAAFISTAGHDPLRDDGQRYAELLAAAGVPVESQHSATLVHGYACFDGIFPAVTRAVDVGLAALRAALHSP